ncbi:MFS transporter, partial [Streptomyces sp. 7N604]|uniref:MFS transporter n=1 Tax=Streptomyces sp. 7N604 TaxID=3457415 RepID=UPI003FCF2BE6
MTWKTLSPPSPLSPQWRVGLAGMTAIGVTFGFARYGYGLFLPEFRREFGLSVSLVGLIGSASYIGYVVALTLVGVLVSRFGPRPLVIAGGLSATVGMGLVAFARGPVPLTAGLILAGSSAGWAWAPYSDAVDRLVPQDRRERVMGVIGRYGVRRGGGRPAGADRPGHRLAVRVAGLRRGGPRDDGLQRARAAVRCA